MKKLLFILINLFPISITYSRNDDLTDSERAWIREKAEAHISKTSLTQDFDRVRELEKLKELEKSRHQSAMTTIAVKEYLKDAKEVVRYINQAVILKEDIVTAGEKALDAATKNADERAQAEINENARHDDVMKYIQKDQKEALDRMATKDFIFKKTEEEFYTKIVKSPKAQQEIAAKQKRDEDQAQAGLIIRNFRDKK